MIALHNSWCSRCLALRHRDHGINLDAPFRQAQPLHSQVRTGAQRPIRAEDCAPGREERSDQPRVVVHHVDAHLHTVGRCGAHGVNRALQVEKTLAGLGDGVVATLQRAVRIQRDLASDEGQLARC